MGFTASIFDLFNDLCLATGIRPTGIKENTILVFGRTRAQELCESRGRRNSPDGLCEGDQSEWGFTANKGVSTIHEDSTAYMISTSSLTIIISFQKLSPKYLRFQLPFYSLFLPNRPFSCLYLQYSSPLYNSSYSPRSPLDSTCLPCAAFRVGGEWDPGG